MNVLVSMCAFHQVATWKTMPTEETMEAGAVKMAADMAAKGEAA
jgi:hypothetical protein